MRSSGAAVRNLALFFRSLKQRSSQFWDADRLRRVLHWVATRLKEADSRIKEMRLPRPDIFWAVGLGSIPVALFVAIAPTLWATYRANHEYINPIATFIGAAVLAYAALKQASTARKQASTASDRHFAQTEADRQRRIVETFTKAVEQLGSDKLEVRVGAIFALERLSKESPNDYWTVMEVLTAFVRERMRYTTIMARLSERAYFLWLQAGRPEGRSEEFWAEAVRLERLEQTPTDIAAILTVIKRRSDENRQREEDKGWRFDLSYAYLRRAGLGNAHFEGAYLWRAHLERAYLFRAHLEGADLDGAYLERAFLWEAHLEGATLREANLEGADLKGAHLEGTDIPHREGANLGGAHLKGASLFEAHLKGAYLRGAHLEGANLRGAHLEGANLRGAHLEGADLSLAYLEGADLRGAYLEGAVLVDDTTTLLDAVGLTDHQLIEAFGDGKTRLPAGITRPKTWPPLETSA
jgi:uncharacterized protein YjbI with pentapeptide repeats